ncbi:MAG: sugar transferase [Bacteriovorax sp.]|nr:sugar transferase [Bacteriovorax sp.]
MWIGKRIFDIIFSLIGLIILSPLFLLIALWIKLDSKGPIFFRQNRVGRSELPFFIHKFRTMSLDAEKKGLQITVGMDSRITNSGHILRKYKIDEFPQLIDVLLGNMSIVGPRPEVPRYVEKYPAPQRLKIFKMRPGITDWASVKFKDENAILAKSTDPERTYVEEILPIKLSYYESYFDQSSLTVDLKIIYLTVGEIFFKRTA